MKKSTQVNRNQLKKIWNNKTTDVPVDNVERKVHIFNNITYQTKGKIIIDKNTWVDYDYSKEKPTELQFNNIVDKETFKLPKYPTLRGIRQDLPETTTLKDMDFYIIRDINEAILLKNNEFHFIC